MNRISKKDKVIVISGRYKGSTGVVLKVFPKKNRVLVEGVNKVRKRVKPGETADNFLEKEAPIHLSNVSLVATINKQEKPTKVSFSYNKDKIKIRVSRKTKTEISLKK